MSLLHSTDRSLKGCLTLPGDKSISHRSLMLLSLLSSSQDGFPIYNLSNGADVRSSMTALTEIGGRFETDPNGVVWAHGGVSLVNEPRPLVALDCGNSGTTIRLLSGLLSGLNVEARLMGDQSLGKRPMKRVIEPLHQMGADLVAEHPPHFPPLHLRHRPAGALLQGIDYTLPMASAQVKSAILLAGLFTDKNSRVRLHEPEPSRDHTERMLEAMGVPVIRQQHTIELQGRAADLTGQPIVVPGDISSAAFWMVGAALLPGSRITFKQLGLNPSRLGVMEVMKTIGVQFEITNPQTSVGEPYADVTVWADHLKGDLIIDKALVPTLIDELPILTILGMFTQGWVSIRGAEELKVKESDRLGAMVSVLKRCGVVVEVFEDGYAFEGNPEFVLPPITDPFPTHHDHRLVMALEILNLKAAKPLPIEGQEWVKISYPGFYEDLTYLLHQK